MLWIEHVVHALFAVADRLLVVNLGRDLHLRQAPEPLLAPPEGRAWEMRWSSEDVIYGGCGTPALVCRSGKVGCRLQKQERHWPTTLLAT